MKFILRIYLMFCEISEKIRKDNINAHAASASFFIIVCFFPMIILLLSMLKYTPLTEEILLNALAAATPEQLNNILKSIIEEIYSRSSMTFVSVTAIATLWTAGKSFLAISNGLDNVYMIEKQRGYFFGRLISSIYTLAFMIIIVAMMILMTFGEALIVFLDTYAPFISIIIKSIFDMKYLFTLALFTLIIMLLYTFVPRHHTSFIRQFPGALFAAAGWQLFTYVYSEYTSYSRSFSYMYGSLNTIIFIMLWLYFCMYILFMGAELNILLEKKIINIGFLLKHHDKRN